jgi:anaerobic selenocysteine-containing dehydrogenase
MSAANPATATATAPRPDATATTPWRQTACIACYTNCGIEIQLGGPDGRHFERIRGDRAHPASKGYACEKPQRLDRYQNNADRLTHPLRRRADGTFEQIDWDTAIREVAAGLARVRDEHGGASIFYYGGGGQGNHLPGAHSASTLNTLGVKYRSNALAQEKTGEMWVRGRMFGTNVSPDLEHAEVAIFVGKNPWQSHGFPHARITLKEIARDPARSMIVIDPRRTETAEMADFHLQLKPGTDAWLLAALAGTLVQEGLIATEWLSAHTIGADDVIAVLENVPVGAYAAIAGVPEELVRAAARRIGSAATVALAEDLGTQMTPHSTLNSYLDNIIWVLTANFAKHGANNPPVPLVQLGGTPFGRGMRATDDVPLSPVTGARIISGSVPCNVIAEEILTDHADRYRAMIVESGNPVHSLADSQRMREALSSLDMLVVIDVAMTETARLAHYVLPTPSQYEKWEATFFNFEAPANCFHLRRPVLDPPPGSDLLTEPEIHARLCEALGSLTEADVAPLRAAAELGRGEFAGAFLGALGQKPALGAVISVLLYRTLGPTLPDGAAAAAALWGLAHQCAGQYPAAVRRAGFEGDEPFLGEQLFDAILSSPSGLTFAIDEPENAWQRLLGTDNKIEAAIPELLEELDRLTAEPPPATDAAFPFVLSAGERRSSTANTIFRDPAFRKNDAEGALRVNPDDAARLGLAAGGRARITTKRGSVDAVVEVAEAMQPGHVSLPNGYGLDYPGASGRVTTGIAPNELTASEDRDWLAGTPWHKHVPARIEALA